MRILMTTDTIGGVWTFSTELSAQLLSEGHAVALVGFGREASPEQRAWCSRMRARFGESFLYRASSAPLEWMKNNDDTYRLGEQALLETASRFAPDVLHTSQYCFGRVPLEIPRVVTAHSDVLSWGEACRPGGLEDSAWLDRYCELVQEGLDEASYVVSPTEWMRDALEQHFMVPCPSEVVHNGRRVGRASIPERRMLRAVSAGRLWDEGKGLRTLMRIKPAMPVMIAGEKSFDGTTAAVDSRVQALGVLHEEALLTAFRTSSIYIAASRYEPFGLAALEAALCGCAVVARDIPSLREVWGEAAIYFDDPEQLERVLQLLHDDGAGLRQAQLTAMWRARRYTVERMAAGYMEIYERARQSVGGTCSGGEEYVRHAA